MNKYEVLLGGGGGGVRMYLVWISKTIILGIEEEDMLLSVFHKYCICAFLCRCLSSNSSLYCLSPFRNVPDKKQVSGQWPDKEGFVTQQMTYKC